MTTTTANATTNPALPCEPLPAPDSETVVVDAHGCVWADGSLLLCPSEPADLGPCECAPADGKPASALMLAAALKAAVKAQTPHTRCILTPLAPDVAELIVTAPGQPRVTVTVTWQPGRDDRPGCQVIELIGGCYRFTGPPLTTDALWQAASRVHVAFTRSRRPETTLTLT